MTLTLNEAFDKVEFIWGIIKDLERGSDVKYYVPDIQKLLTEYHTILLNTKVEV